MTTVLAQPSNEVWLSDRNVVLRAQDTLFKTFMGHLRGISPVFRAMLADTAKIHGRENKHDGLPLIVLDDHAFDVGVMLKCLHNPGYPEAAVTENLDILNALFRMSTKYELAHFRKLSVDRFKYICPDYSNTPIFLMGTSCGSRFSDNRLVWKAMLALARDYDMPVALPILYYRIAPMSEEERYWVDLRKPYICADGRSYTVDDDIIDACLRGAWRLRSRRSEAIRQTFSRRNSCTSDACLTVFNSRRAHLLAEAHISDVLNPAVMVFWSLSTFLRGSSDPAMCKACNDDLQARWNKEVWVTWNALPGYFGLPTWAELSSKKNE